MRKIIANTFITLDGVMQAPGGPEEDPTSGFDYGGWSVNYWDEMMAKVLMDGLMAKPFDLMLGRKTYEIFAAHWPFVKNDLGYIAMSYLIIPKAPNSCRLLVKIIVRYPSGAMGWFMRIFLPWW